MIFTHIAILALCTLHPSSGNIKLFPVGCKGLSCFLWAVKIELYKQELNVAILLKSQFHQMRTYMPSAVKNTSPTTGPRVGHFPTPEEYYGVCNVVIVLTVSLCPFCYRRESLLKLNDKESENRHILFAFCVFSYSWFSFAAYYANE